MCKYDLGVFQQVALHPQPFSDRRTSSPEVWQSRRGEQSRIWLREVLHKFADTYKTIRNNEVFTTRKNDTHIEQNPIPVGVDRVACCRYWAYKEGKHFGPGGSEAFAVHAFVVCVEGQENVEFYSTEINPRVPWKTCAAPVWKDHS